MGFVHHSNYLKYFEVARLEWLTDLGISYKNMEENGILLPVVYSEIKYLYPLKFDEFFIVKVGLDQIPRSKLILNYKIENSENKKVCIGNIHLAFLYSKNHKPTRAPENFIFEFKKKYQL
ncbi:MAG: acyl-CoA thioesterase [Flavobacteriaceae bacterium]|tara:strand:+ start:1618 stop:1977 length:360 start_codon:yes stop_codon:yes gene_type:complete